MNLTPIPNFAPGPPRDVTPSWLGVLPLLLAVVMHSDDENAVATASDELARMADAADQWNKVCRLTEAPEPKEAAHG